MADESYSFSTARTRLEDIVVQVRKKDTSLEKSLDLLEEGVGLANACTELIDRADWAAAGAEPGSETAADDALVKAAGEIAADDSGVADAAADSVAETGPDLAAEAAWDDGAPADELAADDDPSADER